jgi:hypothetical protein
MLATLVGKPFDEPGWVYEEKYDGIRVLAYKEGKHVSLLSRNDIDRTGNFPEMVAAIAKLRPTSLLLDGEVVVFDRKNVSRFQLLQQSKGEVVYAVFDCLYADGTDLRRNRNQIGAKVSKRSCQPMASFSYPAAYPPTASKPTSCQNNAAMRVCLRKIFLHPTSRGVPGIG